MALHKSGVPNQLYHVAAAAVTHEAKDRPIGIRLGVPSINISANLASDHAGMAAIAEQNWHEAFRIALQQIKALDHLPGFGVLNLLHLRFNQIEHDKLATVIGFKERAHNVRAISCAFEAPSHLRKKRINFGRFQRAGPIVIPKPK